MHPSPDEEQQSLLIVGASVRAAVQSAQRAGLAPLAIDMFGDRDVVEVAPFLRSRDYPHDLSSLADKWPRAPFLFTGALENFPWLVERLAKQRLGLCNPPDVTQLLVDPTWIERTLRNAELPSLAVRTGTAPSGNLTRWLRKPYRSGGGLEVRSWNGRPFDPTKFFLQEYREGRSCSALFLANGRHAALVGCTRQFAENHRNGSRPFVYAGGITDRSLSAKTIATLQRLAEVLVRASCARGFLGLDYLLAGDTPWLVEVNPRYTASVELHESVHQRALLADHITCCAGAEPPQLEIPIADRVAVKRIAYARAPVVIPPALDWDQFGTGDVLPSTADRPHAGEAIGVDAPICTLLAEGSSESHALSILTHRWNLLDRLLPAARLGTEPTLNSGIPS